MLLGIKQRAATGRHRGKPRANRLTASRESKQAWAARLVGAMLFRYPTGVECTHHTEPYKRNADRVCFCAYGFPPDMNAEDTEEMNALISAYNRFRRLDLPLLRPPTDS